MSSYWIESSKDLKKDYPSITENIEVDVLIIGAGLTGITSGYFLKDSNLKVAIVERNKICNHVSRTFYSKNYKSAQSFLRLLN